MGNIFSRKKDKNVIVILSAGTVQKLSPFDHKSSKFLVWPDDQYWRDKPSKDIFPASVLRKLDFNPTLSYCKQIKCLGVRGSFENVPQGIYEACVRMGGNCGRLCLQILVWTDNKGPLHESQQACFDDYHARSISTNPVRKIEYNHRISKTMKGCIPNAKFVEVCLGRFVLTEKITPIVKFNLMDESSRLKTGIFFESFGLRRIDKSSITVLTLFLCLNRVSSCPGDDTSVSPFLCLPRLSTSRPGDDTSVSIASQSIYNAAPRARMLIDAFGRTDRSHKPPAFKVRILET